MDDQDPMVAAVAADDMMAALLPLPFDVLYDLGMGPLLRLVASERELGDDELVAIADACWRAMTPG